MKTGTILISILQKTKLKSKEIKGLTRFHKRVIDKGGAKTSPQIWFCFSITIEKGDVYR